MTQMRVFVTGGGRGIGRAIALRFARAGAQVAVAACTIAELDAVVAEIANAGGQGRAFQMDVADAASAQAAVRDAVDFTGGALDVLVNNAGVFDIRPFEHMDVALWKRNMDVNLNGPFYVTHAALSALRASKHAHVFNIASVAARKPFPGNTAYCASKYGLHGFSDALRLDLASENVRVSTVYPGATDTQMLERVMKMLGPIAGNWDRTKFHKPEDVAEVVWKAYNAPAKTNVDDLDVPPPRR